MKKISFLTLILLLTFLTPCFANTIRVPGEQPTIQAGIDVAVNGDMVLVATGTYIENLDILGEAILVKGVGDIASTLIDGGNPSNPEFGSAVTFANEEGTDSILEGLRSPMEKGRCVNSIPVTRVNTGETFTLKTHLP